ncbi:hypothetical protein EW145_g4419 [Phellinidium pouzarii]|uniref:CinA C-terminal domain-containing protein n=1 Tax=Phellinidium pouzarii TaxID=167371 RepID=A0A4S4L3Q4_9AGAM|nr:hypothetical protein EW145_g4419 [Phellinidium pouzarii]
MSSTFIPSSLAPLISSISSILIQRKETVSIAETAAGGLISATLLSVPGASAYFRGGLTVYSLPSRIAFAGWTEENLKYYIGPTPEIVAGLAKNTREKLQSTYAVCESGTAGPTGGTTRNRTPGYLAIAVVSKDGEVTREVETGSSVREENMVKFTEEALKLFLSVLEGKIKVENKPSL